MGVEISSVLLDRIAAETVASEQEVCGLLFGTAGRIDAVRPCRNVAADPTRRFEIDPSALIAAHRACRGGGPAVIGHFHSHPSGSPVPSACDATTAVADGSLWLIATAREVLAWRAVDKGAVQGRFDPVALIVTAACAADSGPPQRHSQSGE